MASEVQGKTALITGAGSGICLELAKALVHAGCNVLAVDLVLSDAAKAIFDAAQNAKFEFVQADVTDWTQLQNAFDQALSRFGRLDIVVPGAGVFEPHWSSFWHLNTGTDTPTSNSFKTLDINLSHPLRATQLAISTFTAQSLPTATILLISSIAAQLPLLPIPLYCAAKSGISAFTHSLAHLEAQRGIRVVAVAPGCVRTPIWTEEKRKWLDERVDEWIEVDEVVEVMMRVVRGQAGMGGDVLEIGKGKVREVKVLDDEGPSGRGMTVAQLPVAVGDVYGLIDEHFGK